MFLRTWHERGFSRANLAARVCVRAHAIPSGVDPTYLPGEARASLSDDELRLFRRLHFSPTPRGDDDDGLPAEHGNSSVSSPDPSVSSSVKTLSHESEMRTAPPSFVTGPKPIPFLSNSTFGGSRERKTHCKADTAAVAPVSSPGSQLSVSVGSHSDIIANPVFLLFFLNTR